MKHRDIITSYNQLQQEHTQTLYALQRRGNLVSIFRLLAVLGALGLVAAYFSSGQNYLLPLAALPAAFFVVLMRIHQRISRKKEIAEQLVQINSEELSFLQQRALTFADGSNFADTAHAYASDLDIFGSRSLFQHLNRTATYMGQQHLASALLDPLPAEKIKERQEAVDALAADIGWRQETMALARLAPGSKETYAQLLQWLDTPPEKTANWIRTLTILLTALLAAAFAAYLLTGNIVFRDTGFRLFALNVLVFFTQLSKIKRASAGGERVEAALRSYALVLQRMEEQNFGTEKLRHMKQQLTSEAASRQIMQLSKLYAGMETVQNPFSAVIMNGLYFFHVHQLHKLARWRRQYAGKVAQWLDILGETELLYSFANLRYNEPSFSFPAINDHGNVSFSALGHPLIPGERRASNDISFRQKPFVILTGSNMSGKSTFLRTLGVNMVLAGAGAPVCAAAADIHPMPLLASMRQSDSLADNESYFFAEVKRLKYIMDRLQQEPCFILLDEILRGTNSDDKRSGTIGMIEKLIRLNATGVIATHDLEVCLTTEQHPDILSNKCFEVENINNELVFDYKLREGICRNKSATFLMKKMGIIKGDAHTL